MPDWSEPVKTAKDPDWTTYILPHWPLLLEIVEGGDALARQHWNACAARFDAGKEPETAEEANARFVELVACVWRANEQAQERMKRAKAARRKAP